MKKRWNPKSIRFKMVLYSMLCVIAISTCGNLYLFSYLNKIIIEKATKIDEIYIDHLTRQIEESFGIIFDMSITVANHYDIMKAMKIQQVDSVQDKKMLLQAQEVMNDFLESSSMKKYVNKMMLFNEAGTSTQAVAKQVGSLKDIYRVQEEKLNKYVQVENRFAIFREGKSITPFSGNCFSIVLKVSSLSDNNSKENGYLYVEVDHAIVRDVLSNYSQLNDVIGWNGEVGTPWIGIDEESDKLKKLVEQQVDEEAIHINNEVYKVDKKLIAGTDMSIYNFTNITALSIQDNNILYTLIMVLILSTSMMFAMIIMISKWITNPISKLIERIQKITENDFSYDPDIEKTEDEMGEVGRVINQMVQSVANLMDEVVRKSEEKSKVEMALLQAQVNPHFLYNTLDSIHWMAVIQKAPGISNITRSLSNLLKNMAKGVSDKISIQEELSLLQDYITIQSIRYAETFQYVNDIPEMYGSYCIVKMTLQPIVENAIFHGLEPSEKIGMIRVSAREDETYLYIDVEDNGIGMNKEQIEGLFVENKPKSNNTMSGMGISNVNKRLKLIYGRDCGLSVESEIDHYTRVTVKLRKESM